MPDGNLGLYAKPKGWQRRAFNIDAKAVFLPVCAFLGIGRYLCS